MNAIVSKDLLFWILYFFLPGMRIQECWEDLSLIRSARLPSQGQNTWFVYFKILIGLFRIICDNGDNMEKVAKNVFLNEDPEHFVNCWKVPTVSLKPWAGTDKLLLLWCCQINCKRLWGWNRNSSFSSKKRNQNQKWKDCSSRRFR